MFTTLFPAKAEMGNAAASDNKMRVKEDFIARTITGGGRLTNGNEKFVVTKPQPTHAAGVLFVRKPLPDSTK
jgi:hypothetical protein